MQIAPQSQGAKTITTKEKSPDGVRASPDLLFLFAPDDRPDRDAVRELVTAIAGLSITAELGDGSALAAAEEPVGFELQCSGLTFDLVGLMPGAPIPLPEARSWLAISSDDRLGQMRSLGVALGPHIRAGQADVTVLRSLLDLARILLEGLPQCRAICWTASGTIVAPAAFAELVQGWRSGGTIPAQMIVSVKQALGGGIETTGLAYFTGQELRLEPAVATDAGQATLLALRLSAQLVHRGRLTAAEDVSGPDGRLLRLEPSPNGRFVRVWPG